MQENSNKEFYPFLTRFYFKVIKTFERHKRNPYVISTEKKKRMKNIKDTIYKSQLVLVLSKK